MRFFVRIGTALFALSLVLAACGDDDGGDSGDGGSTGGGGGGGGDALTEEEFVEEANAICADGNAELEEAFGELEAEPDEEFVNDVLIANIQGQIDDIRDLEAPEELADDVNAVLDDAEAVLDEIADDPEIFLSNESDPFEDINPDLAALGLSECAGEEEEGGEETE